MVLKWPRYLSPRYELKRIKHLNYNTFVILKKRLLIHNTIGSRCKRFRLLSLIQLLREALFQFEGNWYFKNKRQKHEKIRPIEFLNNVSPAKYHNNEADVDCADRFRLLLFLHQPLCYDILPVNIVQEFNGPFFHCLIAGQRYVRLQSPVSQQRCSCSVLSSIWSFFTSKTEPHITHVMSLKVDKHI